MMWYVQRCGAALFLCTVLCSMEFTTPKKKRGGPTASQLTADVADELKEIMCELFDLTDEVTQYQRVIVDGMETLVEQSKDSFFARASRDELHALNDELERNKETVIVLKNKIRSARASLHARLHEQKKS
jgi:hypothetical protein